LNLEDRVDRKTLFEEELYGSPIQIKRVQAIKNKEG